MIAGWGYREVSPEPAVKVATQPEIVMDALSDGPGTSAEIALETGIPMRHCSAVMGTLHRRGLLDRKVFKGPANCLVYVYSLRGAQ